MKGFFITGTDTEIGKTTITAGLTHAFSARGLRVAPIKSLAAGCDEQGHNDDVERLFHAQTLGLSREDICPLLLQAACAPHIAAKLEGRAIAREPLLAAIRATAAQADLALVEGVGGFRVPLRLPGRPKDEGAPSGGRAPSGDLGGSVIEGWDTADMAVDLQLPVVLVVGLRLGCISHALLTAEAVRARGLRLAGWVGNTVDAAMPHLTDNLDALRTAFQREFDAPCWGHVPRLNDPSPAAVAAHLTSIP